MLLSLLIFYRDTTIAVTTAAKLTLIHALVIHIICNLIFDKNLLHLLLLLLKLLLFERLEEVLRRHASERSLIHFESSGWVAKYWANGQLRTVLLLQQRQLLYLLFQLLGLFFVRV